MILGLAGVGLLAANAGTLAVGAAAYGVNKIINKKSEYEMKKLENEGFLERQRLAGEQQKELFEAKAEADRRLEDTRARNKLNK